MSALAHARSHATPTAAARPLRVGVVGGVDRMAHLYERAAASVGWELEHHTGQLAGRGAPGLAALVDRVDLLIVMTDINSHNAVLAARKLAAARGRRLVLTRRCSPSRMAQLLFEHQG